MQTALHVHENACMVLIVNTIENYLSPAYLDHYAFFLFTPCKAEQPRQDMELQEKETQKD